MIKAILFDLDGTLSLMDQDEFTSAYMKKLISYMAKYGYKPEELIKATWKGVGAMAKNDGSRINMEAFWDNLSSVLGDRALSDREKFDSFYLTGFKTLEEYCPKNPRTQDVIRTLKSRGYRLIIASNPIFPETAHRTRIEWTGASPDDFEYISAYENSSYCKPNPMYYTEIIEKCGLSPDECIMVGNNVKEDMAAEKAGIRSFLLTYKLINEDGEDIAKYPSGDFDDMMKFISEAK